MQLKKGELKIYYKGHDFKMEDELEIILKKYGYYRWASGFSTQEDIRDLAFDKKED